MKSLMVLTTFVAIVAIGFQYWNGPTLEQRLWKAACAGDSQTYSWHIECIPERVTHMRRYECQNHFGLATEAS